MLQLNSLQYLTKILLQYFNCNERLEIFLTCFCNILQNYYYYYDILFVTLLDFLEMLLARLSEAVLNYLKVLVHFFETSIDSLNISIDFCKIVVYFW